MPTTSPLWRRTAAQPTARVDHVSEQAGHDDELLPEQSADDTDRGWGERPDEDDDQRIAREKPPHY